MDAKRILHVVLTAVGIGAVMAYLIACRPDWSPDGSKILFPYGVDAKPQYGVALHDRNAGTTPLCSCCRG